jgi:hypothetical protein
MMLDLWTKKKKQMYTSAIPKMASATQGHKPAGQDEVEQKDWKWRRDMKAWGFE